MKKRIIHIIGSFLLSIIVSTVVHAANTRYQPLRYQLIGITDKTILSNIDASLTNLQGRLKFPLSSPELHHFVDKAPGLIQAAIEPYGYFRSQVTSHLTKTNTGWLAQFNITPGQPLPIRAIQIDIQGDGKKDPKIIQWEKTLPFKIGDTLSTPQFETTKNQLYDIAAQRGYFSAKTIKTQIIIDVKKYTATIIFIYDTGPRFRFGDTTFSKTPFYESFLRRFLAYKKGDYYDAKKLEKTQEGMVNSNYFNQVIIRPKPKNAVNNEVPVELSMILRKSKVYTLGLGYGSDTGVRGTLGLTLRRIGHVGHRFQTLLRASQNNSSLVTKYIIPGLNPANDLFSIGAGVSNIQQPTGNANNVKFALAYSVARRHWKHSLTLAYLNEHYNINTLPNTSTQLVYPTFESKYINADNLRNPHKGLSFEMQYAGATHDVLSETSFFQTVMHLRTLYTIEKTQTRLLFRTDAGHTTIANLVRLPLSLQLVAGGSRSVRGYGFNSLGPGRNLVVGSTEIQQRVYGAFYLTAFFDAGVVGNQNIFQHVNMGTGPGLAWISPIGTIELTVANAFTQATKPWSFQFTMGSAL